MTCTQICYASDFGRMDGVLAHRDDTSSEFLPTRIETRLKTGYFDLNNGKPFVQLSVGNRVLAFDADSISIKTVDNKFDWSSQAVAQMVELLALDTEMRQAALDLRNAMLFLPLQYVGESGHIVPGVLAETISGALVAYEQISKTKRERICKDEFKTERVVEKITEVRQKIITAAEQLEQCLRNCAEQHPDKGNLIEKGGAALARAVCAAGCTIRAFVDIVVGVFDVVTEIVRDVVTKVVVCQEPPPNHIAVPFEGKFHDAARRSVGGINPPMPNDASPTPDDFRRLFELLKTFGDLSEPAECLLNASWTVRDLRDLGYKGIGDSFPLSFSICFDAECVNKLLAAGPKAIGAAVTELGALAKSAPIAATAVKLSSALALKVLSVAVVVIGYQALMIIGQLLIQQKLGNTKNGVCLTHPTVVVGLAGTLFGPLGVLSGGLAVLNTPFIVTPR